MNLTPRPRAALEGIHYNEYSNTNCWPHEGRQDHHYERLRSHSTTPHSNAELPTPIVRAALSGGMENRFAPSVSHLNGVCEGRPRKSPPAVLPFVRPLHNTSRRELATGGDAAHAEPPSRLRSQAEVGSVDLPQLVVAVIKRQFRHIYQCSKEAEGCSLPVFADVVVPCGITDCFCWRNQN